MEIKGLMNMSKRGMVYEENFGIQQRMELDKLDNKVDTIEMSPENFQEKPYLKDLYIIRAFMRNRFNEIDEGKALEYLEYCYNMGVSIKGLREIVMSCESFREWMFRSEDFMDEYHNQNEEDKVRLVLHNSDIRELKVKIEKEFENIIDELCENGFIRYKDTENELASVDISTRVGQIKADRLLNNLNVIDEIYKEISNTTIWVDIRIENGQIVPIVRL